MTEDEKTALHRLRLMRDLIESPAWKALKEINESQIDARKDIILAPAGDDAEYSALKMEYLKGAMYGIQLAISTPYSIISDGEAIVAEHRSPTEEQQEELFDE